MFPTITGSGASVFVIERSACVLTEVVAVAELFPGVGSVVAVVAVAVLEMTEPLATFAFTCAMTVNVADAPAASVLFVAVNVPVPPTDGVVSVNAGPPVCVAAGSASLSDTVCALLAPLFVSEIV